ncbi:MAG: putative ABC transport system permease protein [Cyclobacteriaceae bacterium]
MDKKITISSPKYSAIWPIKMAIRDSRKSRKKLFLFIASISFGIAALVGITSFRENLLAEIDDQAKELLGADFSVSSNQPIADSIYYAFKWLSQDESSEVSFASMVYFPRTDGTRLAQVRALTGSYPYYGSIETDPPSAALNFRTSQGAIVDEKLLLQYNVELGDSVKIGQTSFKVLGKIKKIPGQSSVGASVAPVVYIPGQYLESTELLQKGSRINYEIYFQFHPDIDTANVWAEAYEKADKAGYDVDTIEERKSDTGDAFKNLSSFLELIAYTALLLGCLGVASSIYVYMKSKVQTVAVLRCLGMKANQAILIFLYQVAGFGLIGSVIGSALGVLIHLYLPIVAAAFIPVDITTSIYWPSVIGGVLIGVFVSVLFGLLSLVSLRRVSPLSAIRLGYEATRGRIDRAQAMVVGAIILFIYLSLFGLLGNALEALVYAGILLLSILLLYGMGSGLVFLVKKVIPSRMAYVWRQGFSNLYRPNNQTVVLITTIGLSTAFLGMLYFMQDLLVERVSITGASERPNTVLFDIQTDQKEELKELTLNYDLPVMQDVPIVTMRLLEVNGHSKTDAETDTTLNLPDWAFNREYRVTYRDHLIDSEEIVEGEWIGQHMPGTDSVFISISKGYAENLELKIGDEILFNVQGAEIKAYVGSFRDIDWRRVQTNFLILFPAGLLEKAPQFHVLITRIDRNDVSARFQQAVVRQFPNVSIIDLELILKTLEDILGKVAFVIRFMAIFSIGTGLIVLISSIVLSRYQRMQESVLLRTLGASSFQLWKITFAEYAFLGSLGAFSGIFLASIFTTLLGKFVFEFTFIPDPLQILVIFASVTSISIFVGLINNRNVVKHSPLEVLRNDL